MCSITLWNAVGNGSVTVSGSFENHAVVIRSHKANWHHSLTLGKYEPDSATVWLYVPCRSPGLILNTVWRHWELFKVFRAFPTDLGLGRVMFFSPSVIRVLYWAWAITSAGISVGQIIRVTAAWFNRCQWSLVNLQTPTIRSQWF